MHHAILGPGGVGGLLGACLAQAGENVTMVVRQETLDIYPRQLTLESPFGNFTATVEKAAQVPACDVLWVAVKTTQLDHALRSFPSAQLTRAIVPLQNGIDHIALLRARYGAETVFPATFAGETERVRPGYIAHRTPFARLQIIATARPLLAKTLDQFRQSGFMADFIEDEATLLWSKLVLLAPLALTTSAAGAPTGAIRANPDWRARLEACVREACAVGTAEGAKLDPDGLLGLMTKLPDGMRSSMQKDIEQGNPPELDAIGGPILRGGIRHGIPTPVTRSLVTMVEQKARLAS
jgi:2-dehydropantoate 2-reductase